MDSYIEKRSIPLRFFASANSSKGFINDFPQVFGDGSGVERLYIVKGGPGTGKSYFMRKAAQYAEGFGYHATYYHCSSDPTSLDGIRLEHSGHPTLGFLDGTAPHTWEASLPGAREEIVDLGAFWDASRLREEKAEISRLTCEKSKCYARAYRYLGACGEVSRAVEGQMIGCIREAAVMRLAKRLLRQTPSRDVGEEKKIRLRAVGMSGEAYLDTFERMSKQAGGEILFLDEYYGIGYTVMAKLYEISKQKAYRILVSHHPIHPHWMDGLYYPDTGRSILVIPRDMQETNSSMMSVRRYLDSERFRSVRGEVRHGLHLVGDLKESALRCLREAGDYHFALEKIYASAMDFQTKDRFENDFLKSLFSSQQP